MDFCGNNRLKQKENPREKANFFSMLFFWWMTPLLRKGAKKDLTKDDMFKVLPEDESKVLGDKLEARWNKELEAEANALKNGVKYQANLGKAAIKVIGPKFLLTSLLLAWEECVVKILQPLFMSWLVQQFSSGEAEDSMNKAYGYGAGVVGMAILINLTHHRYYYESSHIGMKLRVAHSALIYRKALRLSNKALGQSSTGQMVNLLSNDVKRLNFLCSGINFIMVGPLQFCIVTYLTWQTVGNTTFVGVGLILLLVPLQGWLGKKFSETRAQTAMKTDGRIQIMNEIIQGIKVIKMYAWENSFSKLVGEARKEEIAIIQRTYFYKAVNMILFYNSSKMVMALTLLTYVLMGEVITAEKAFLTLSLFNLIRSSMAHGFPIGIQKVSEALISLRRIESFLRLEEKDMISSGTIDITLKPQICSLDLKNVTGKWTDQSEKLTLDGITFTANAGELTVIVGPVGSGKGSILQAILGEMPIDNGKIKINGTLSYAAQEPWIFSRSVRENILLGQPFDSNRYWDVVKACALATDIAKFEHRDSTLVGERGVQLSGGQKARINLARAIYRNADIYLLDDPLSAVDAHVGRHLFDKCIKTFLKNKVVILVTHQIQYLKEADNILVLQNGKITHQGCYETIINDCEDISSFLAHETEEEEEDQKTKSQDTDDSKCMTNANQEQKEAEESVQSGKISNNVIWSYMKNGANVWSGLLLLCATLSTNVLATMSDMWMSKWSKDDKANGNDTAASSLSQEEYLKERNEYNLMVYGLLVLGMLVACIIQTIQFFVICMTSSKNLHNKMFANLLRTETRFFDVNPSGRILNRFSKDMGSVDDLLPNCLLDVKWIFLTILSVCILISYIRPVIIIPTIPIAIAFYLLRQFYLKTSRSVKRIEGVTKSPIFSQLSTSLNGLTSIRGFKAQDMMIREFDYKQDCNSSAWFVQVAASKWFAINLDWLLVAYLVCCILSFLLLPSDVLGGEVGVVITSCIYLTGALQFGIKQSAEAENLMTSVERIIEYGQLKSEDSLIKIDTDPEFRNGVIEFQDVSLRYDPNSKLILKNISFKTECNEKIGIVGRTGAGKSSLIVALFRLCEPSGKICIDGIDISSLGLHELRKNMSIIPQDPLLFFTTLRRNLDPFDEHNDSDIWTALDQAHLASAVKEMKEGMETKMSEGGSNLSVGQRQLVCLARAILRKNKILLLDEATANVDPKTDAMIQETIRTQFKNCTVLTVAHRLNTVMDSDKILVLDDGYLVEFDAPSKLLENPDGYLTKLVDQTGGKSKKKLVEMAKRQNFY